MGENSGARRRWPYSSLEHLRAAGLRLLLGLSWSGFHLHPGTLPPPRQHPRLNIALEGGHS